MTMTKGPAATDSRATSRQPATGVAPAPAVATPQLPMADRHSHVPNDGTAEALAVEEARRDMLHDGTAEGRHAAPTVPASHAAPAAPTVPASPASQASPATPISSPGASATSTARVAHRTRIGADALCEALLLQGVDVFFSYPGGVILPFYDVLGDYPELRHILVRHEQGGA
ncbi:MAG TPA: thiamine pyrophosphate-binding protein, partial [Candidatus Limnocylindrales bacterium]